MLTDEQMPPLPDEGIRAWVGDEYRGEVLYGFTEKQMREYGRAVEAAVRKQMAERKPLTNDQIMEAFQQELRQFGVTEFHDYLEGVRFAEQHHGITQQGANDAK